MRTTMPAISNAAYVRASVGPGSGFGVVVLETLGSGALTSLSPSVIEEPVEPIRCPDQLSVTLCDSGPRHSGPGRLHNGRVACSETLRLPAHRPSSLSRMAVGGYGHACGHR